MHTIKGYTCPICKDMLWLLPDVPVRDPRFGKAVRCHCQKGVDAERRRARLQQIDGLRPAEREIRFERLLVNDANRPAVDAVERAVVARRGMVTLTGAPGTGKSTLLICAVNAAREVNIPAVYTTVTDLLDYLRAAFDPRNEGNRDSSREGNREANREGDAGNLVFARRWELLLSAEVLALDELDEFSATPWALERFQRLVDERWRSMDDHLTLLATNARLSHLPAKIASRLSDGRAKIVQAGGRDMRPAKEWE